MGRRGRAPKRGRDEDEDDLPSKKRARKSPRIDAQRSDGRDAAIAELEKLRSEIEKHLRIPAAESALELGNKSRPKNVKSPTMRLKAKRKILSKGRKGKCWECGKSPSGGWIVDHIPPKELTPAARQALSQRFNLPALGFRFFPHCSNCAGVQSELVKKINKMSPGDIQGYKFTRTQFQLLANDAAGKFVASSVESIAPRARIEVSLKGDSNGCHTCGSRNAASSFDGDHFPPETFARPIMQRALQLLDIRLPKWQLYPHCKKCSRKQGTQVGALVSKVEEIMREHGQ